MILEVKFYKIGGVLKKGDDIFKDWPGIQLIHHNLPGDKQSLHSHEEHQIFIPLAGQMQFTDSKGDVYPVGRNSLFYIPPRFEHSFESSREQGERLIVLMDSGFWSKLGGAHPDKPKTFPNHQLAKELIFYLLVHEKSLASEAVVQCLGEIIFEIVSSPSTNALTQLENSTVTDQRILKALSYMDDNLGNAITISEVAKNSGASSRSLSRLFHEEFSMSPSEVLKVKRIRLGQELLLKGKTTVTEVAMACGYQSLSQFIRVFRGTTGKLPSEVLVTR